MDVQLGPIGCVLALVMVVFATASALAEEPTTCTTIRFSEDASSAAVNGSVGSDPPFPCYKVATDADQTATFKFTKTNGNMAFSILDVVDDRNFYAFKTAAKTYKFIVFQDEQAPPGPFTLEVSVE